jgi:plastocyanin
VGAALAGWVVAGTVVVSAPAPADARVPAVDQVVTVHVRDNSFSPADLAVGAGTTVRWVNDGRNVHDVTPNVGHGFGIRRLAPGASYVHTFSDPGSYAYYCSLHGTPTAGQHAGLAVGDAAAVPPEAEVGAGAHAPPRFSASGRTIRVPADAATVQGGVNRARTGDLVLVSPGVYRESVTVATPGVVIRGVERNTTILDGEFRRKNGVFVAGVDGVAVENLTARNFTENGFFWSGVLGYRGSYLTASRNGDYGIYAYDSQYGQFDHSYASGSPDSGFYIGQCNPCHAVITDVVAEHNALGYSGTNSSGDLFLVNSIWRHNRTGIVPNSLDVEELPPQGHATIAGNLVDHNGADSGGPASDTDIFDAVYGGGVVLIGGVSDLVTRNRVVDSARIGIALAPNPFGKDTPYPASDNTVTDNVVQGSGLADLGVVAFAAGDGNCFAGNRFATSAPTDLEALAPCGGAAGSGDPSAGALDVGQFLDTAQNPPGTPSRLAPVAPRQRNLPRARVARARPAGAPVRIDLAAIRVPSGG